MKGKGGETYKDWLYYVTCFVISVFFFSVFVDFYFFSFHRFVSISFFLYILFFLSYYYYFFSSSSPYAFLFLLLLLPFLLLLFLPPTSSPSPSSPPLPLLLFTIQRGHLTGRVFPRHSRYSFLSFFLSVDIHKKRIRKKKLYNLRGLGITSWLCLVSGR